MYLILRVWGAGDRDFECGPCHYSLLKMSVPECSLFGKSQSHIPLSTFPGLQVSSSTSCPWSSAHICALLIPTPPNATIFLQGTLHWIFHLFMWFILSFSHWNSSFKKARILINIILCQFQLSTLFQAQWFALHSKNVLFKLTAHLRRYIRTCS